MWARTLYVFLCIFSYKSISYIHNILRKINKLCKHNDHKPHSNTISIVTAKYVFYIVIKGVLHCWLYNILGRVKSETVHASMYQCGFPENFARNENNLLPLLR